MKTYFTLLFALVLFNISTLAQPGDRIEQLHIAFLTEELNLSTEEAQQFWPIFNEFNDARRELHHEVRRMERKLAETTTPSEEAVLNVAGARAESMRAEAELLEEYISKSLLVLGPERTVKLMNSEREFKRRVLERIEDRRGQ